MMKRTVPFLLMATALGCGSDVDLELDFERDTESPAEPPADSPRSSPPIGQPAWSQTDLDHQGYVHAVAWATDGGLLATVPMADGETGELERINILSRHEADGTLDWEVRGRDDDFLGVLSPTAGGGAVVAVSPDWGLEGPNRPAGLDWYDADGTLTASWRPAPTDTEDPLREINAVQTLPDGGVFWAGQTLRDDGESTWTSVAGRLDAEGRLLWLVTVPLPNDDDLSGQPTDVALTPDGGIILLTSYLPAPAGDALEWSSFVVRFASDGTETWRQTFLGDGHGNGIAVAPSGNVVVAGNFGTSMTVGDLHLEDESYTHHHFVAELDPAGQAVGLSQLEVPASIDSDEIGALPNTMTMVGEELVVGGMYYTFSSNSPQLTGYYAAANSLDGALVAEIIYPADTHEQLYGFGPVAADATVEGRLAFGGSFSGRVDFGDGEVDSGMDEYGFPRAVPFIAVLDPREHADDVD